MRGNSKGNNKERGNTAPGDRGLSGFAALFLRRRDANGAGDVWLIVGLGNPGAAYEQTRHNVGFRAIDKISADAGIAVQKKRFRSLVGEGRLDDKKIILIKPQTYMNDSGDAVRQALKFCKTKNENMIVIYDDVDIELGKIRLRAFGGTGSHNGMRSIADHIGDEAKFPRIRIGIGKQPGAMELRDYVLKRFSPEEAALADAAIFEAAAASLDIVRYGIEHAMNLHNPKKR